MDWSVCMEAQGVCYQIQKGSEFHFSHSKSSFLYDTNHFFIFSTRLILTRVASTRSLSQDLLVQGQGTSPQ